MIFIGDPDCVVLNEGAVGAQASRGSATQRDGTAWQPGVIACSASTAGRAKIVPQKVA